MIRIVSQEEKSLSWRSPLLQWLCFKQSNNITTKDKIESYINNSILYLNVPKIWRTRLIRAVISTFSALKSLFFINYLNWEKSQEDEIIPYVDIWETQTLYKIMGKAKKPQCILLFVIIVIIILKANLYIGNGS